MRSEQVVNRNGVIYVTVKEFAERVGASDRMIWKRIKEGKLACTTFDNNVTKYIAWETGKAMYSLFPKQETGRNHSKPKPKKTPLEEYHPVNEKVSSPRVTSPSVAMPSMDMPEPPEIEDMSSFDKNVYADCLDETGEFDYDKLKVRLTSEAYKLKQDKDRGLLVEKTEVITFARRLGIILNNGLESVPQRYTSILLAKCQTIISSRLGIPDFEFTEEERVELRAALKSVGPEIMKSLKLVIEEMTEEEE